MNQGSGTSKDAGQLEGRYANCFKIGQNAFEFVLEFGQFYHESGKENFHTRVITSPDYAKVLFQMLYKSIQYYEQTFRKIEKK